VTTTIHNIINSIKTGRVRISEHARDEAKEDSFTVNDIFVSVYNGEIIENYPKDKPYPSCLICGFSSKRIYVHSVWAYNQDKHKAVLITVYKPDPDRWINFKTRKTL
jgi:hypothetical protein